MTSPDTTNENVERVVRCPVEGCDAEKLSRGIHLHVLRTNGNGHGEQGVIPDQLDFDDLEVVGWQELNVNYPSQRETEDVARLCPYCKRAFKGKNGVLIHLGQVAGRKNHPPNASRVHVPEDFPVVKLDENENIIEVVGDATVPESQLDAFDLGSSREVFAEFTKSEVDYLFEVVGETRDDRALRILKRAYMINNG